MSGLRVHRGCGSFISWDRYGDASGEQFLEIYGRFTFDALA
jgi:hypothetical protein